MNPLLRRVRDTNVLFSAFLRNGSIPHRALLKARMESLLIVSDETLGELGSVLMRDKFNRAVDRAFRENLLEEYERLSIIVPIQTSLRACRDPKDDKFLELAVDGRADAIVTGDSDPLELHPFRGIAILTPADYLNLK